VSVKVIDNDELCFELRGSLHWLKVGCIGVYDERSKAHNWYKRSHTLGTEDLQCFELFFHRQPTKLAWIAPDAIGLWSEVEL